LRSWMHVSRLKWTWSTSTLQWGSCENNEIQNDAMHIFWKTSQSWEEDSYLRKIIPFLSWL
jgi:hypothetical protein